MNAQHYIGMTYEQASREAERLINSSGWFVSWGRLETLREIMLRHLRGENNGALRLYRDWSK